MKIGTITFHGAYNYGSVLQAYALQKFILSMGERTNTDIDYQIINYRPSVQKQLYWQTRPPFSLAASVKYLMRLPYKRALARQAEAYEDFISNALNTTEELSEKDLVKLADKYDFYLSGSDQVFNIRSLDFTFANLLNFTDSENKISYAASLGPLEIDWNKYNKAEFSKWLGKFKYLSLREKRSKDMADKLLGADTSEIHVDPTLLLSVDEWRKIQSGKSYNNGQYILIYCLEPTRLHTKIAKQLSLETGLPVVSTGYRCKYDYFNPYVKLYDSGPADFLSLIDNAAMVLTSSFHGTVFSIIYDKPFWVIDGVDDNRIRNLLEMTELTENSIPLDMPIDFTVNKPCKASDVHAELVIERERKRSEVYLMRALGIEEKVEKEGLKHDR